eukprot:COSAG01_NODE_36644_length_514_cov_1.619277_2_plen_52_part_01
MARDPVWRERLRRARRGQSEKVEAWRSQQGLRPSLRGARLQASSLMVQGRPS